VRERSFDDNATPAANGIAIASLVRLALATEDLAYLDRAEQALRSFGGIMQESPQACPSLFTGLDWFRNHTLVRSAELQDLGRRYLPTAVLQVSQELQSGATPAATTKPIALVCQGLSCHEPAMSVEQMEEQVWESLVRNG
jgi:uncharacterized protein